MTDSSTIIVLLTITVIMLSIVIVALLVTITILVARVNHIAKNIETVSANVAHATEWINPVNVVSAIAGFFGGKGKK